VVTVTLWLRRAGAVVLTEAVRRAGVVVRTVVVRRAGALTMTLARGAGTFAITVAVRRRVTRRAGRAGVVTTTAGRGG
jgi:hypothetical protein